MKVNDPTRQMNGERDFLLGGLKIIPNPSTNICSLSLSPSGAVCTAKQSYDDAVVHYNSAIKKDPAFFEAYESKK